MNRVNIREARKNNHPKDYLRMRCQNEMLFLCKSLASVGIPKPPLLWKERKEVRRLMAGERGVGLRET